MQFNFSEFSYFIFEFSIEFSYLEYGDMQLIAEAYHMLKSILKLNNEEISKIFHDWNQTELNSYLIDITSKIFKKKDEEQKDKYVIDIILDVAGQKGMKFH